MTRHSIYMVYYRFRGKSRLPVNKNDHNPIIEVVHPSKKLKFIDQI